MTIDDRARDAARALRDDVAATAGTEAVLAEVLADRGRGRTRWLPAVAAAIAIVALVAGAVAIATGGNDGDNEVAIDMDPDAIDGTPMQLLGPRDGRDSVRLPIAVEPASDLAEGDTVHVRATGFVPGESVGIVQCTSDVGDPIFAGIDACLISPYTSATADADGVITGDYPVQRLLTVPVSGTVDCAAAPNRCMIAAGALSNYDRSGAISITFTPTDEPYDVPIVDVAPATGLSDGQVVHVSGSGFTGNAIGLDVCSASPSVCWTTGDPDVAASLVDSTGGSPQTYGFSLAVSSDGLIEGDVPVWRFLPGAESGTYIDCAVSACTLRFRAERAPAPVPLAFAGAEPAPLAPVVQVAPDSEIHSGDTITVQGGGFPAGAIYVALCAYEPADVASPAPGVGGVGAQYCTGVGDGQNPEIHDGAFSLTGPIGSFADNVTCDADNNCTPVAVDPNWNFAIEVQTTYTGEVDGPAVYFPAPYFAPARVPVGFIP